VPDRIPPHGTPGRYQGPRRHNRWQACRCDLCRAAALRNAKQQELRRLCGIPAYINRHTVATHVRSLLDAGWDRQQIADTAGVSRKTVFNVLNSTAPTVQRGTAEALLALRPENAPAWRPAIGAMRRVRALSAMGWPLWWTAERAGISETGLRDICSGRTKTVSRARFDAIDRVYRTYAMRIGPSDAARTAARAKQWATAAAWNDIDDPTDRPHSVIGQCERRRRAA
jgi:lambda repressor-like predicted transcriptional regulator